MKKITCVYTGLGGLVEIVEKTFSQTCGDLQFDHIADSGLIADIIAAGEVTPKLERRICALFDAAAATEADMVVSTCSSIGDVARKYAAAHPELPVLSIDYPMARYAAQKGKKVGILSTLSTTVRPSAGLVRELAREEGREVEVVEAVAEGAFDIMRSGDVGKAEEIVLKTVKEFCSGTDIILLAQASMSVFRQALAQTLGPQVEILESPSTCAAYLKENL